MKRPVSFAALILILAGALMMTPSGCTAPPSDRERAVQPTHAASGFLTPDFYRFVSGFTGGWEKSDTAAGTAEDFQSITGGVVPHHLLAGRLIAGFFAALAQQEPEIILIAGPNHHNKGGRMLTGRYGWETPFGVVEGDADFVELLLGRGMVEVNEEVLGAEHSIRDLMPFVKYYLPAARVVPLILHRDVTPEETERLAKQIGLLGNRAVLAASVDFSHYLTAREAAIRDRETMAAIKGYDLNRLWKMGNDHLDSPPALVLLLQVMKNNSDTGFTVLEHTNSGYLLRNDAVETTSYFTLLFGDAKGGDRISQKP